MKSYSWEREEVEEKSVMVAVQMRTAVEKIAGQVFCTIRYEGALEAGCVVSSLHFVSLRWHSYVALV